MRGKSNTPHSQDARQAQTGIPQAIVELAAARTGRHREQQFEMSGSQDEIPLWLPILTNQDYRGRVRRGGTLQRLCLELLRGREDDPDGLPTSTRFLFYELVQSGAIEKHGDGARRADQGVIDAVFHLREIGLIPWEWI